ncbi:hypothetical protein L596_000554 [Steinernema carpocapsae]|uniref:Uncharacterized protein n=1 Tax=Steinernema carpocapsae TaxID=34508 RepID=A0A4U8UJB2_STECR|nr:hypothetical protein L596_000554 [Steinernema carpocapsae]
MVEQSSSKIDPKKTKRLGLIGSSRLMCSRKRSEKPPNSAFPFSWFRTAYTFVYVLETVSRPSFELKTLLTLRETCAKNPAIIMQRRLSA